MIKENLVKFGYIFFFWFVKYWWQITIKFSKVKNIVFPYHESVVQIVTALDWGKKWKKDPFYGILDIMPHPTKVQDRINRNLMIDDCDGHAIYWATSLLKSQIARRAWIGIVHMKDENNKISGHCVCLYKDDSGEYFWCDYSKPNSFDSLYMFDWVKEVCDYYGKKPVAAGFFQIHHIDKDFTPIFDKKHDNIETF